MTVEEKSEHDTQYTKENPKPIITDEEGNELPYEYPQVAIEYISSDEEGDEVRTPAEYVTFTEWINETKIVQEAVEEVSHIEMDGESEMVVIDAPYQPEVTELVRPYVLDTAQITEKVETYPVILNKIAEITKNDKLKALSELKVTTTAGNIFDADDQSRSNIVEALKAAEILSLTEYQWKLSDNSIVLVDIQELEEALALGIQAKGDIILGL